MPKYNDFELDIQTLPTTHEIQSKKLGTKYCETMWCTEKGCSTKPTTLLQE